MWLRETRVGFLPALQCHMLFSVERASLARKIMNVAKARKKLNETQIRLKENSKKMDTVGKYSTKAL